MHRLLLSLLTGALVGAFPVTAGAQATPTAEQLAVQWLQCIQQHSNGQVGPDSDNPIARSAELVTGLAAMGQDAASLDHGGASLADFLKTSVSTDVGTTGELLLARAIEPSTGPTAPVIAQLTAAKSLVGDTAGEYGGTIFADALAILGLRAAGQPIAPDSIQFLRSHQNPQDHGWSFDTAGAYGSDSNTTALVVQALIATGLDAGDSAVQGGMAYLGTQFVNGGFVSFGTTPDPQSDELGIQAIAATSLAGDTTWGPRLQSALADLRGRQLSSGTDRGAFSAYDRLMATTPAPAALLQRPLTQTGVSQAKTPLLDCPAAAATTPTPPPSPSPASHAAQLAQTGSGPIAPLIAGVWLVLAGLLLARRHRAR